VEYQIWEHDKADDGESRCIGRRHAHEVRAEYHALGIGEDRIIGDYPNTLITLIRTQ